MANMVFKYGMRSRGFSPGCQPVDGLICAEDDPLQDYHNVLVYDRMLSRDEVKAYELDFIRTERFNQ